MWSNGQWSGDAITGYSSSQLPSWPTGRCWGLVLLLIFLLLQINLTDLFCWLTQCQSNSYLWLGFQYWALTQIQTLWDHKVNILSISFNFTSTKNYKRAPDRRSIQKPQYNSETINLVVLWHFNIAERQSQPVLWKLFPEDRDLSPGL